MTAPLDEAALRRWLVDYLITNRAATQATLTWMHRSRIWGSGLVKRWCCPANLPNWWVAQCRRSSFGSTRRSTLLLNISQRLNRRSRPSPRIRPSRSWVDEPVAVIGLGCRFPGGIVGPEAFWQFLCDGRSAVGEVPPDRWAGFGDGSAEATAALSGTTRWGSFLADVDAFDAEFFEISPREAAKMDPQQRLLLEVTYEAL